MYNLLRQTTNIVSQIGIIQVNFFKCFAVIWDDHTIPPCFDLIDVWYKSLDKGEYMASMSSLKSKLIFE